MTHICWNPDDVNRYVGAAVAEALDAETDKEFLDRHVPMTLHGATVEGSVVRECEYSELDFLNQFLTAGEGRSSVLGAVIGESGHGKTHYLLWVERMLRQQRVEHRQVVRIPRIKTSLPGIIEELIKLVPEGERGEFHDIDAKLRHYRDEGVTDKTLRLELKNALTVRLCREENKEHFVTGKQFGPLGHIAAHYVKCGKMLDLLSLKVIQDWLISEDGIIGQLVRTSIRPDGADIPVERSVSFDGSQIPCSQWRQKLLEQREQLQLWTPFHQYPMEFAELLNWALEHAVKDFMATRFSVQNPEDTIVSIRRAIHRASPDASIVLLMEDLANARYAEADLLNACTWEEGGLVPMRTLFATTTGLFQNLRLSVRQRISPTRTELPLVAFAGEAWSINGSPELEFASKYLPVFRRSEDGEGQCSICNEASCREAFGSHRDVGLYPLSVPVLEMLAKRVLGENRTFHPRTFLRHLVAEIGHAAVLLRLGRFPDERLEVESDPSNRQYLESLEAAMRSRSASQEEVRRAKRIAKAYGRLDGPRGFRVHPLVWELFRLEDPGGAVPERVFPHGDLATARTALANCSSVAAIDAWKRGLTEWDWSSEAWEALLLAEKDWRERLDPRPRPPQPVDGINKWVDGAPLLESDDEKLKGAVTSYVIHGINWSLQGIAPTFPDALVTGASNLVVAGSVVQDGEGMQALHVKVGLPEDPHGGISERKPYLWLHEMRQSNQNNKEAVGLPAGSAVSSGEDYGKLADVLDYVQSEIQSQVRSVWGGLSEQAAWLLRWMLKELASLEDCSVRLLPRTASVPDILEWLRHLQDSGVCADRVNQLLLHISSFKRAPFFADAYWVAPVALALEALCEDVSEPEAVKEATGSNLLKRMRLEAPGAAEAVRARRRAGQAARQKALAALREHVGAGAELGRASLQALARKAWAVAEDMLQVVPDCGFRQQVERLREVTDEWLGWLRQSDAGFEDWSETVRLDRRSETQALLSSLEELAKGVEKRKKAVEHQSRNVPDVEAARSQAVAAIQKLRTAIQGGREGV